MSAIATPERCDVAIVGAGILGLACARELVRRRPGLRLVVLEREDAVARHQTGHNSGVIHAGIYYAPGSLKARLCVEGAALLYDFCAEHGIPAERAGKLVVAAADREVPALRALHERARANGVPGIAWVDGPDIPAFEPHARGAAALHSPATGVVDFAAVARRLAAELAAGGHEILLGARVTAVEPAGGGVRLEHSRGRVQAGRVLFCAGAWSDRLAGLAGAPPDPRIVPFRGAYLRLRPERRELVRAMIYPVPRPELPFLGVHLTRHVDGSVSIGPTALLAGARDAYALGRVRPRDALDTLLWPGTRRLAWRFRGAAREELGFAVSRRRLVRAAARYVPALELADVVDGPAGVRAQAVARDGTLLDDFAFSETPGALHVRNAPSPAATAALAIARVVADRLGRRDDCRLIPL